MTASAPDRKVPRWLHVGACLAVASTFILLILGQLVTSFRAGMADPIWPTEPWYLFNNQKDDFPYLVEHSHRIAGFTVGVAIIFLVLWSLWTEPRSRAKWIALTGLLTLIVGFLLFFVGMLAQRDILTAELRIPKAPLYVMAVGLVLLYGSGFSGLLAGVSHSGLRVLGSTALVAVMIQGLLGGFRVRLNELVGTDLAAIHGIFAQVVMSLLVLIAVLTERVPTSPGKQLDFKTRPLGRGGLFLTVLVFVQIVWGAIVRHEPTPLMQRLHFLTAFLALAIAVLLLRAIFAKPVARMRIGLLGWLLSGLLIAQIYLGVEAWMMKFGLYTLPELVPITQENATIRTLHALIGSGILMSSLALAVRLMRTIETETPKQNSGDLAWTEPSQLEGRSVETVAGFSGNTT
jgi:cytochrome c oxidase assembly protein subunit 15